MKSIISIFFISAIIITGSLMMAILLVWPNYQEFNLHKEQIQQKELELRYNNDYVNELKTLSNNFSKKQSALAKVDFALPSDLSISSLFDFLETSAKKDGLILESIGLPLTRPVMISKKIHSEKQKGKMITIQTKTNLNESVFHLGLSGSYSSLKSFIYDLENSARLIEIDSINFSPPLSQEETTPISFGLTLKVYSFNK